MPDSHSDLGEKLRKLGQHLRVGWAIKHPVEQKDLESVRDIVREKWEKEQAIKSKLKPSPSRPKEQQRKPPEPEQER
jgi:hypothetical protein